MYKTETNKLKEMFEAKMNMVEELTGKNVMIGLEMQVGPKGAKVLYQQMFACFVAGFDCGRRNSY